MRIGSALAAAALLAGCNVVEQPARAQGAEGDARGMLFVSNKREASVSRISLASGDETGRAPTCPNPHELAISPDGHHLAIGCYSGRSLEIFRTADLERVRQIDLAEGARPHGLIWHESGAIVAGGEGRGSIFIVREPLSENPDVREIASGDDAGPHMVVADRDLTAVWGTVVPTGTVLRFDVAEGRVSHRKVLGGQTEGIALAGDDLWVGANAADKAYRLDPDTLEVEAEVATGGVPIRVLAHPDGRRVAVSEFRGGAVGVIDSAAAEMVGRFPVSGSAEAVQVTLLFSPDGSRLYAAETGRNQVAEVDFASGEVLRRLPTGDGGDGLAIVE
jgi:DNA-binding beta-propeller fold protein YncE